MKKIGIVVVTYNRLDCLKKNIEALKNVIIPDNYNTKLYIINNSSTDGTKEWLDSLNNEKIEAITLDSNEGGAGGFHYGIKYAVDNDMDYIWGMDDDAYPTPNSLIEIIKIKEIEGENSGYWSNCNKDINFEGSYKKVDHWMFVGFFISTSIIKKIGYPRKDFFIYHDDTEYSRRIIKNGNSIFKVKNSIINHKDAVSNYYEKKLFNKIIKISKLPDWKMYYLVRNGILLYSKKEKEYWHKILIKMPKLILKTIILNPKQLKIVFKGYWHGIIRKSGKVMQPN